MGKVTLMPNLSCLFSAEQLAPTGHKTNTFSTHFSPKMVSTRSRAGVNKQAHAGSSGPAGITPNLAAILEGQAKMQQELTDLKKRNADEMEALRQENSRLRRKIEVDPTLKGKAKEASKAARSPAFQPTEEESEYNPTPHTFTTTNKHPFHPPIPLNQGIPQPQPLPLPSLPPKSPTTYPSLYIPHMFRHATRNTFQQTTSPLTTLPPPSPLWSTIQSHPTDSLPISQDVATPSPLHRLYRQHTSSCPVGTLHADAHLKVYITHVALYTSRDAIFCKAFPTTLKGPALEWFTTLPPYFIDSFDVLSHMFFTHFVGNRPHQTTTISLLGIRQEQGEPLRAFIDRFSKAALRTPHLNQEMIIQCMALTLQSGPFANNVYLHPPASMHELKLCAADYVRMEEMQTLHTKFCNDYAATTANPTPPPPRPDTRPHEPRQSRFTRYAPLTVSRSRILDEALQADLIPPPRKTTTPPNADMTKYCRYLATMATLQKTAKHSRIR